MSRNVRRPGEATTTAEEKRGGVAVTFYLSRHDRERFSEIVRWGAFANQTDAFHALLDGFNLKSVLERERTMLDERIRAMENRK